MMWAHQLLPLNKAVFPPLTHCEVYPIHTQSAHAIKRILHISRTDLHTPRIKDIISYSMFCSTGTYPYLRKLELLLSQYQSLRQ